MDRQVEGQTGRQTDRQMDKWKDRQVIGQTEGKIGVSINKASQDNNWDAFQNFY
jgi:hypothetical protein